MMQRSTKTERSIFTFSHRPGSSDSRLRNLPPLLLMRDPLQLRLQPALHERRQIKLRFLHVRRQIAIGVRPVEMNVRVEIGAQNP